MNKEDTIYTRYKLAKAQYADIGVDTEALIQRVDSIPISIHCWQGDDVTGFEKNKQELSGGILATGSYPGKARNIEELQSDLQKVCEFVPGAKKINLQPIYLDSEVPVARDEVEPSHFKNWVDWAKSTKVGLDFSPSCFSHPFADSGFTLSHSKKEIRDFWIRHVQKSRAISDYFGKELGIQSILNIWIPDGYKDTPIDLLGPRQRLLEALDECIKEPMEKQYHIDSVESKLFGIGFESYVVGSHEFYMGYAMSRNIALCVDTGHFHPTELISSKLSALSLFLDDIFLHISRPVRWDSDHVVTLTEELLAISQEVMRHNLENNLHIGTDFFDASINRVAAWIIGARNVRKSLLIAGLEPTKEMCEIESNFDFTKRLVFQEELKGYPWQDVWNYYCLSTQAKCHMDWFEDIRQYEKDVLVTR